MKFKYLIPASIILINSIVVGIMLNRLYVDSTTGNVLLRLLFMVLFVIAQSLFVIYVFQKHQLKKSKIAVDDKLEAVSQDMKLRAYIINNNLTKVYVSRKMYRYFFKTLTFARIFPSFFYNKDGLGVQRTCRFIIDPYLKDYEFNMAPKNQIINDMNDLI